jgi:pimeloyl-ACP methyl ester carboxylesterase
MRISANGIGIEVDDQGPAGAEPILLIMGLGMQLIGWPDELVRLLVARGFRVIRFDNRDAGLSQGFDQFGAPNLPLAALRFAMRLPVKSPYSLADMAGDALGVLDVLGVQRAHVCGASMGGMIAQHLAAEHPQRLKSLTLMMTTSGARKLPQPSLHVQRALMSRPAAGDLDAAAANLERVLGIIGSPAFRPEAERLRVRLNAAVQRAYRPAGVARQLVAVMADGDRSALLGRIGAPTLVIHGRDDPLIPVACGHDLLAKLPDAVADIVPGMGHDLPLQLLERFADGMRRNAARAA